MNTNVPTIPGTAYEGGFYAGRIMIDNKAYAIIVAPKESGQSSIEYQWKTSNDLTGALSLNDGLSNSNAMNDDNHPAAQFCRSLNINGYTDWYLPSRDELEVCYRNLKPSTYFNIDIFGINDYSIDINGNPNGIKYTENDPQQTAAIDFQIGGSECFERCWYWSSTEYDTRSAWHYGFSGGSQVINDKSYTCCVRAIRKVLI